MDARKKLLKLVLAFNKASDIVKPQNRKKVAVVGVNKEKGWLYYVDEDGDISRTRASRGRKSSKKTSKKKVTKKTTKKKTSKKEPKKKIAKKKVTKKNAKKKKELMQKIKTLEKRHSLIKNKTKGHDELKDKIKLLKQSLKKLD